MSPSDTPNADIVQRAIALAQKHQKLSEERMERWGPEITKHPVLTCEKHEHRILTPDVERSAFESAKHRRVVISYLPCPDCANDAIKRRAAKRLLERGIPARSLHITMETWDTEWESTKTKERRAAKLIVKTWVEHHAVNTFLLILGHAGGTGKTALGVAALKAVAGADLRCVNYRELIEDLQSMDNHGRKARIRALGKYSGLMVDDFGNRRAGAKDSDGGNEFERDQMAAILEVRFEAQLPTIITSNLDPATFAKRLDDRTVDRIRAGRVYIDAGSWPSRRAAEGI